MIKFVFLPLVLLAACATPEPTVSEIVRETPGPLAMPSTLEAGLMRIEALKPCSSTQVHEIIQAGADQPPRIKTCIPEFPPTLMFNEYQAACLSSFTLTNEGAPADVETKCAAYRGVGLGRADNEIANAMFERAMQRVIEEMRYAPVSDGAFRDPAKRYTQPLKFAFEGGAARLAYPDGFTFKGAE